MTGTASRTASGNAGRAASPRLLELIDRGELDWDNPRHREAYLRAWVNGDLKDRERALDDERRPACDRA